MKIISIVKNKHFPHVIFQRCLINRINRKTICEKCITVR